MPRPAEHTVTLETGEGFDALLEGFIPRRPVITGDRAARALRCISSGYLSHGCRCHFTIPEHVAVEAWERECMFGHVADRFFRVLWRDEVWLAYGVADGTVRGVYCPDHRAEREERAFDLGIVSEAAEKELTPV